MVLSRYNEIPRRSFFIVGQLIPLIGVFMFHWDFLSLAVVFYLDTLFDFLFRYFEFWGSGQSYSMWNELRYPDERTPKDVRKYRRELVKGYTVSFLILQTIFSFLMLIVVWVGLSAYVKDSFYLRHIDETVKWTCIGILAMLFFRIAHIYMQRSGGNRADRSIESLTEINTFKFFLIWITIIIGIALAKMFDTMHGEKSVSGIYFFTFGITIIKIYTGLKEMDRIQSDPSLIQV